MKHFIHSECKNLNLLSNPGCNFRICGHEANVEIFSTNQTSKNFFLFIKLLT